MYEKANRCISSEKEKMELDARPSEEVKTFFIQHYEFLLETTFESLHEVPLADRVEWLVQRQRYIRADLFRQLITLTKELSSWDAEFASVDHPNKHNVPRER